jgi:lipid-A-disaccharide synthase-like uncharacterized protein
MITAKFTTWEIVWNIVGWIGQIVFASRVYIQWYVTEKKRQVVVPAVFWWFSIAGSMLLLLYALFYDKHFVVIISYLFSWIPYTRNLIIHYRHKQEQLECSNCGKSCPPKSKFCFECGNRLSTTSESVSR